MSAAPQTRSELEALIETNITDELLRQNTAAAVREVLLAQNQSAVNVLDDGAATGTGGDYSALLTKINTKLDKTAGPNPTPSAAYKQVIFLTKAEAIAAGRPNCATLDQLDPLAMCTGAVARVDLYPGNPGQELILCYSPDGPIRTFIDGNQKRYLDLSTDGLNPNAWFKKGSQEAALASIRRYSATYAKWGKDETMKIDFNGTDAFFSAVAAGGPFAAPTAPGVATADWKPATAPAPPSAGAILYKELGFNEDGALTQKAASTALNAVTALIPSKASPTNQLATLADIGQISFVDVPLTAVNGSYPIQADCAGKRFIINDGTASTFISLQALSNASLGKVFAITISNGVRQQVKPVAFGSFIGGDYIELGETALLLAGKQAAGPSFYYNAFKIGPPASSGLPPGGAYRDPYAVGDKPTVVAAVIDASNTWVNGDLAAYGTSALQDAGAPPVDPAGQAASILVGSADVAHPDTFDKEDVNGGAGWRYVYGRRNDGTSGWTRIPKG